MPRYSIVTAEGRQYYPMRYDELRVGPERHRATAMVPYYSSVEAALLDVHRHVDALLAPLRRHVVGSSADPGATYHDKLANPTVVFRGQDDGAG